MKTNTRMSEKTRVFARVLNIMKNTYQFNIQILHRELRDADTGYLHRFRGSDTGCKIVEPPRTRLEPRRVSLTLYNSVKIQTESYIDLKRLTDVSTVTYVNLSSGEVGHDFPSLGAERVLWNSLALKLTYVSISLKLPYIG